MQGPQSISIVVCVILLGIKSNLNPYLLLDKVYIVSTQEIMHFDSINMILSRNLYLINSHLVSSGFGLEPRLGESLPELTSGVDGRKGGM